MTKGIQMNSFRTIILAMFCSLLSFTAVLHAQTPASQHSRAASPQHPGESMPLAFQGFRVSPSGPLRFLASEEGRSFLQAIGHPIAPYAIQVFGQPSKITVVPQSWYRELSAAKQSQAAASSASCNGVAGVRFNLEPRIDAVPQNQANADFLPNRIAPGEDLIVQAANDWRGNFAPPTHWDQNVSGYYVHRSLGGCSVQFEGGLPTFTFQGNTEMGTGDTVVAADPARDAFFMADVRFASTGGVGLFRASASALLDPTQCANGTHTQAQAMSCWASTPPVLLFPEPSFDSVADLPQLTVDERATGAGTGAGDVYVVDAEFNFSAQTTTVFLAACTNSLNCGQPVLLSGSSVNTGFPYVRVRTDGLITVSYVNANSDGSDTIFFANCKPAGAPNPPTCAAPVTVATVTNPIAGNINVLEPLLNINLLAGTFPKHADRTDSTGKFTTFLMYDDCKNFTPPNGPCVNAEVLLTASTDNGKTWSTPVSVDKATGHHFYPAITTDTSTGIVTFTYYSTQGDFFNHEVEVWENQIFPGTGTVGTPQRVTKVLDPIDSNPKELGLIQSDFFMGVIARGDGVSGQSRVYTSFDSTTVPGNYEGRQDPELNNHISVFSY
jgi:hypothetical protein